MKNLNYPPIDKEGEKSDVKRLVILREGLEELNKLFKYANKELYDENIIKHFSEQIEWFEAQIIELMRKSIEVGQSK